MTTLSYRTFKCTLYWTGVLTGGICYVRNNTPTDNNNNWTNSVIIFYCQ